MTQLVPAREAERLDALRSLAIVDTAPEPFFDAVCSFARDLFRVPIATIAFIDEDKQWFKARCGTDEAGSARDVAFCARTILFDAPLVVTDASADQRFANNPLVLGPPGIRFYAGVPLALHEGLRVGTFCLIDIVPRIFASEKIRQLQGLAEIVVAQLRIREASHVLTEKMADCRRVAEGLAVSLRALDGASAR